jgi:hypothetical protein
VTAKFDSIARFVLRGFVIVTVIVKPHVGLAPASTQKLRHSVKRGTHQSLQLVEPRRACQLNWFQRTGLLICQSCLLSILGHRMKVTFSNNRALKRQPVLIGSARFPAKKHPSFMHKELRHIVFYFLCTVEGYEDPNSGQNVQASFSTNLSHFKQHCSRTRDGEGW